MTFDRLQFSSSGSGNLRLDEIRNLPKNIKSSLEQIEKQLLEASVDDYSSILKISNLPRQLINDLSSLSPLDSNNSHIDSEFSRRLLWLVTEKSKCSLLAKTFPKSSVLLDIPRIMEYLVKNQYYEELFDLFDHVRRIEMHSSDLELIKVLSQCVTKSKDSLIAQLKNDLIDSSNIHTSIGIIGYFKRLSDFSEAELRFLFLGCRCLHYTKALEQLHSTFSLADNESRVASSVKSLLDLTRSSLVDLLTQYRAIFFSSKSLDTGDSRVADSLLPSLIEHLTNQFYSVFVHYLDRLDDFTYFGSILQQSMHVGLALSRKGLDIRYKMGKIINRRLLTVLSNRFAQATAEFMRDCEIKGKAHTLPTTFTVKPPEIISQHPAMVNFLNSYFSCLNSIRTVPLLDVIEMFTELVEDSLQNLSGQLAEKPKQTKDWDEFKALYNDIFVPYVKKHLSNTFSGFPSNSHAQLIDSSR